MLVPRVNFCPLAGRALACLLLLATLGGCSPPLKRFEFTRLEMGVKARIVTYALSRGSAESAAAAAFGRVAELDAIASDYRPDSEMMRLCAHAPGEPVPVSKDLFELLQTAQQVSELSGGTFDVTVGPVVALWRKARTDHALPSDDEVAEAMESVGWRNIILDQEHRTATLRRQGMKLDMGGIAKGYAAEEAVKVLRAKGQPSCLVALAGDIFAGQAPPDEPGWRIELTNLDPDHSAIYLENEAVSTSGDAEQFVELRGVRYSHIIDPRTGMATTSRIQATVVAPHGAIADAVSKPATVFGPEAGAELAGRFGAALIATTPGKEPLIDDGAHPVRWATPSPASGRE